MEALIVDLWPLSGALVFLAAVAANSWWREHLRRRRRDELVALIMLRRADPYFGTGSTRSSRTGWPGSETADTNPEIG